MNILDAIWPGGEISLGMALLMGVWLLSMIAVPLAALSGERGKRWGISGGVLTQVLLVGAIVVQSWPVTRAAWALAIVPLLGLVAEVVGSSTGIPFGRYHYTAALQPQIRHVPVQIPLAWLMMMPPSWAIAEVLVPNGGMVLRALVAGFAFMAWDVYLDPHLVTWKFWQWDQPGRYLGIPLQNFAGWFLWATVISFVAAPLPLITEPLVVVYLLTWVFQAAGHVVFWRWPISAAAGFVTMGIVAVPALLRIIW